MFLLVKYGWSIILLSLFVAHICIYVSFFPHSHLCIAYFQALWQPVMRYINELENIFEAESETKASAPENTKHNCFYYLNKYKPQTVAR